MVKNRALKRDARVIKASTGITYPRARDLLADPVDQDTPVPSLSLGYGPGGEDITYRPGKGSVLVIEGPSGFGKSVLMTRLAAEAADVASVYVIDVAKQGSDYQWLRRDLSALETTAAGALALVKRLGQPRHTVSLLIVDEIAYTDDIPGFSEALQALSDSGMPIIIGGQAPHQFLSPALRTRAELMILDGWQTAAYRSPAGNGQVIIPPGGQVPDPEYSFMFGTDEAGSLSLYSPARDRNLLVTGRPGTGKTWLLHALATDAAKSMDVYIGTAGVHSDDVVWPLSAVSTATSLAATADMLDELMLEAEIRSRQHYGEVAAEHAPRPVLIVLDELSALVRNDPHARAASCPPEDREARTRITVAVGKIARAGRAAGVSLVLASQTADLLQLIPGSGDLKVNLSRLVLGSLESYPPDLREDLRDQPGKLLPGLGQGAYKPLSGPGGLVTISLP
jgi:DNA replication protein DnaC